MLRRRSPLFWATALVVLAGIVVYGPALAARSATGPGEPVSFLSQPLQGWSFVAATIGGGSARAGSPGTAAAIAARAFAGTPVDPQTVALLWLPDRRLSIRSGKGTRTLTTNSKLVWLVTGRLRPGAGLRPIGLIDYSTGKLRYALFDLR